MKPKAVTVRIDQEIIDRADALIEEMTRAFRRDGLGDPKRTTILQMALARGINDLESEYTPKRGGPDA